MPNINIEIIGPVNMYLGLGLEIITALILGGMIGYDREQKMKSAGIKTNILICLGATLYTALSLINLQDHHAMVDPNRIAAQIVSGIGFLGAGAIMHGRGSVIGLTTAATIWVVAAVGMTIGFGYPVVATLFTVTILLVLRLLGPLYRYIENKQEHIGYHLEILSKGKVRYIVKNILLNEVEEIKEIHEEIVNYKEDQRLLSIFLYMHPRKVDEIMLKLKHTIKVEKVNYTQMDFDSFNKA